MARGLVLLHTTTFIRMSQLKAIIQPRWMAVGPEVLPVPNFIYALLFGFDYFPTSHIPAW